MTRLILPFLLFFCCASSLSAQYLETFTGQNGKGLLNAICPTSSTMVSQCGSSCTAGAGVGDLTGCTVIPPNLSGVDWTITATTFFTDASGFGFDWSSPDDFGVEGEKLRVNDPDQEICWVSPVLNISAAVGDVTISVGEITQAGDLDASPNADYIKGEYRISGGSWIQFGYLEGNFTTPNSFSVSGLSGTTLEIRICAKTNGASEIITFDNISVPNSGVSTGCAAPSISTAVTEAGSCNGTNGTIKVTASGGTPGYNVAWSGPSSGNPGGTEIASSGGMYTISPLTPGTYTITVTDAASCSSTTSAMVATATALSLSTQVLPADCPGAATGEIDLTVNNGAPPYSYSWSNLPGSPDPQDQTGLTAGSYTVTVTDNAGCSSTTSAAVGTAAAGAYLETFSIDGKGILDGSTCSGTNGTTCTNNNFVGVNWSIYGLSTLSGVDANDYFKTTSGKLEHKDIDQDVCWESPEIDINPPGTGVAFSVDLAWFDFDREPAPDYIDVEYSLDGGAWTRVPNQVGGGISGHTIVYAAGPANDIDGSTTVNVTGLSGSTLRIRVCGLGNSEGEIFTIDNVSVPGSNGLYCPCPTITFTATPTNTCSGANNGQIAVTGVSGGTGPYMYSKDNGANFQSGATFTGLAAGMYDVVVKDANACVSAATQVTVGTFSAPACSVSGADFVCNNTPGNIYTAPGGMSAYNWSISGDGSIPGSTTGSSVSVTSGNYLDNYTVSVTVTDANGCTSTCSKVSNIFLLTPPANITVSSNPACFGVSFDLSVAAAASSTVAWTGEGVTNPNGNPSTTALPASTGLKTYSVTITTDSGCSNTDEVEVTVENCNIDFSGKILFSNNNSLGVNNANVALTGSATGSDLTDINGDFSITTVLTSGNFTLTPTKTANKLNGVTVGDASAIQQHVANITLITDLYKLVAADVNKSNSITTTDASIINQSILGNPAALAQFKTSWRFAPTSHTMASPPWGFPEQRTYTGISGPQTNQDFYGIKTGDVTTSFANPANFGAGEPMILNVQDQVLESGEEITIGFSASQLDDLAAFQFALRFDTEKLGLTDILPHTALPLTVDNFGTYNLSEGEIRAAWSQTEGVAVEDAAPVFSLKFNVLQSGAKLREVLYLDESELPALAYNGALAESKVELKFSGLSGTGAPSSTNGVQLLQNRPNPFSGQTVIGFVLPEACEAQLRVFDVSGKMLAEKKAQYPAGRYEEIFNLNGATGVLYYELTTPFGVLAKKMVATEK